MVVSNNKYGDRVMMQVGTQVIDQLVAAMAKKELHSRLGKPRKQVHLGIIVSKRNTVRGLDVPEYDLKGVNM